MIVKFLKDKCGGVIARVVVVQSSDSTPYQQALKIAESPTDRTYVDGERIVETLLSQRRLEDLSLDELRLLFKGYNWWGKHDKSFEAVRLALLQEPNNMVLLQSTAFAIRNSTAGDGFESASVMARFDK